MSDHEPTPSRRLLPHAIPLAVVLGAAAMLRFDGLGAKNLWLDETLSWRLLHFPVSEMLSRTGGTGTVHPPFYFLVLRWWVALWGDSEFALRSLSAILGVITVAGVYGLVWELLKLPGTAVDVPEVLKQGAAALAADLVALSPFQIHMARQARGYTLATALVVWGGWCLIRALRSRANRGLFTALCGLLALAACYTHYVAIFSFIALGSFVPVYLLGSRGGEGREPESFESPSGGPEAGPSRRLGRAKWPIAAALAVGLGFVCWLPALIRQTATVSAGSWQPAFSLHQVAIETEIVLFRTFANKSAIDPVSAGMTTAFVYAVLCWLLVRGGLGGRFLALAGLVPVLLILAYSSVLQPNLYYSRYLTFAQLAWLAGLGLLLVRIPTRAGRWAWAVFLIGMSLWSCSTNRDVIGPDSNPGMRGAMDYVRRQRAQREPIVAAGEAMFLESLYYLREGPPPRFLVEDAWIPLLEKSAHLKPGDWLRISELAAMKPSGIWCVYRREEVARGRLAAHLSIPITLTASKAFPQDYRWEGTVVVEHYVPGGRVQQR